jgi:hypothetical protein
MMRWAVCSCSWLQSMASSRASHVSVTTYFSPNTRRRAAGRRRECADGTVGGLSSCGLPIGRASRENTTWESGRAQGGRRRRWRRTSNTYTTH